MDFKFKWLNLKDKSKNTLQSRTTGTGESNYTISSTTGDNDSSNSSFPELTEEDETEQVEIKSETLKNKSNLSLKCQKFMFKEEYNQALSKAVTKERTNSRIQFDPLVQYIELNTIEPTGRLAEEALNIYVRLQYPTENIFQRRYDLQLRRLEDKEEAENYWNTMLSPNYLEEVNAQDSSCFEEEKVIKINELKANLSMMEQTFKFGSLPEQEDENDYFFPDGDRRHVEDRNFELMAKILHMLPLKEHRIKVKEQFLCELFTNFASIMYIVTTLTRGDYKSQLGYILGSPILAEETEYFDSNESEFAFRKMVEVFEREKNTFDNITVEDLNAITSLPDAILQTLTCRIFVEDVLEEEEDILTNNQVILNTNTPNGVQHTDLCTRQKYNLIIRNSDSNDETFDDEETILEDDSSNSSKKIFFEVNSRQFITNPTPIVVSKNWYELDILGFLGNPWNSWNMAKLNFLKIYYDFLNQVMVSCCLNSSMQMLKLVTTHETPENFKDMLLATCLFADNAKSGTVQLKIYNNDKRKSKAKKPKRLLNISATSFFLKPLARADLYYSYAQHCLLTQPCTGHRSLLLLHMIKLRKYDIARLLMLNGVSPVVQVCELPASSISWGVDNNNELFNGLYPHEKKGYERTKEGKLVKTNKTEEDKFYACMVKPEENGGDVAITSMKQYLRGFITKTGLLDDNKILEIAKSLKITPIAIAVETAIIDGDNTFVEEMFELPISVSKGSAQGLTAIMPVLDEIANYIIDSEEAVKKGKKASVLRNLKQLKAKDKVKGMFKKKVEIDENVKFFKRHLFGIEIPSKVANFLRNLSNKKTKNNIKLLALVSNRFRTEMFNYITKVTGETNTTKTNRTIKRLARVLLLRFAVTYEYWNVVRLLTKKKKSKQHKKNMFTSKNKKIEEPFERTTAIAIETTIDDLLKNLSNGNFPHVRQALFGLYFLLKELKINFKVRQYESLFVILTEGILNLPFPRAGTIEPLQRLLNLQQIKQVLSVHTGTYKTFDSFDQDGWNEQLFQEKKETFIEIRKELAIGCFKNSLVETGEMLISNDIIEDESFLKDLVTYTTLNNTSALSVPHMWKIVKPFEETIKETTNYMFINSLHHAGLSRKFIMSGFLSLENVLEFMFNLLATLPKLPTIDSNEIIGDFSSIFTLMAVVEFMKTERVEDHKDEIYKQLFDKIRNAKEFWIEGMNYLFEFGRVEVDSPLRDELEIYVEKRSEYIISYDPLRQLISLQPTTRLSVVTRQVLTSSQFGSDSSDML